MSAEVLPIAPHLRAVPAIDDEISETNKNAREILQGIIQSDKTILGMLHCVVFTDGSMSIMSVTSAESELALMGMHVDRMVKEAIFEGD